MSFLRNLAINGITLKGHVDVIDCHAHLGPAGWYHQPNNSPEEIVKIMDRVGVSKAFVSHSISILSDFRLGNKLVHEAIKKYPERFAGYAVLNPNYPDEVEEEIEICFKRYNMKAIKFHRDVHQYPLDGENYKPVLDYAESNGLTILCHGFGKTKTIREICSEYKNVNFIAAHYGSWDMRNMPEVLIAARDMPNLYLDSSGSVEWFGGFDKVVARTGADKILFGSDFPWSNLAFMIGRVLFAKISDDDKRRILGENAKLLFTS